jgi:type II secretory pathway pseudopilin PulG
MQRVPASPGRPPVRRSGFTLLEVAVVAILIIMLAGIVVPQFQGALEEAQTNGTRQMLERVRTAVEYYAFQHDQELPGGSGGFWSAQIFLDQLMLATDLDGDTAPVGTPGFPFGPYLTDDIGPNPFNDLATLKLVGPGEAMGAPDEETGWVFFAETGAFRANTAAEGHDGAAIWEL